MRAPSKKRLMQELDLDSEQANLVRSIAHAASPNGSLRKIIDNKCPDTAAYVRSMYSDPYHSCMWRRTVALHAIDRILGTCGVEALGPPDEDSGYAPPYEYLNSGDTYATTW